MTRRPLVIAATLLVMVAAAGATWWVLRSGSVPAAETAQAAAATQPSVSAAAPLSEEQAKVLGDNLTSGAEDRVRAALAVAPKQPLDAAAVTDLARLMKLTFDLTTYRDAGQGRAQITARVDGRAPGTWLVGLVAVDGQWKVSTTEPAR